MFFLPPACRRGRWRGSSRYMKNFLNNRNAQAIIGEYIFILVLALATFLGMMVYFQRVIQARLYDARQTMTETVSASAQGYFTGNVYGEYEPYYTSSATDLVQSKKETTKLNRKDVFTKKTSEGRNAQTISRTLPPYCLNASCDVDEIKPGVDIGDPSSWEGSSLPGRP